LVYIRNLTKEILIDIISLGNAIELQLNVPVAASQSLTTIQLVPDGQSNRSSALRENMPDG
jgi:hypothetical protein